MNVSMYIWLMLVLPALAISIKRQFEHNKQNRLNEEKLTRLRFWGYYFCVFGAMMTINSSSLTFIIFTFVVIVIIMINDINVFLNHMIKENAHEEIDFDELEKDRVYAQREPDWSNYHRDYDNRLASKNF